MYTPYPYAELKSENSQWPSHFFKYSYTKSKKQRSSNGH